jgi:hypothetical protein
VTTLAEALSAGQGIERKFHCENPDHIDSHASAWVNSITGAFFCFACGWGGHADVDRFDVAPDAVIKELRRFTQMLENPRRVFDESWLNQFDAAGPGEYWLSRFSPQACWNFRLGVTPDGQQATIPMRDLTGNVLGVYRRNLDPDAENKYEYIPGVEMNQLLYNYQACTNDVLVLTEGATDAIAAWEAGYDAMAVYGNRATKAQRIALARYGPKVVIGAFDADEGGQKASAAWYKTCESLAINYRRAWPSGAKDLASMSVADRRVILNEAHAVGRGVARIRIQRVPSSHADRTNAR